MKKKHSNMKREREILFLFLFFIQLNTFSQSNKLIVDSVKSKQFLDSAFAKFNRGDYNEALKYFSQSIRETNKPSKEMYFYKGLSEKFIGDSLDAMNDAKKAILIDKNYFGANMLNLEMELNFKRNFKTVKLRCDTLIKTFNDSAKIVDGLFFLRAMAKFNLADTSGSIADISKAIFYNSKSSAYHLTRVTFCISQEKFNKQIMNDLDFSIKYDSKNPVPYFLRALMKFERYNDKKGACEDITIVKGFGVLPDNDLVLKYCK